MCRNTRVLHHFEPPTTPGEIEAAAVRFVRKVSGELATSRGIAQAARVAKGEATTRR